MRKLLRSRSAANVALKMRNVPCRRILQNQYKWIDANRTGLWGWSYGGFTTGMVLAQDATSVFKCGISVAPVTSWIYYGNWKEKKNGSVFSNDITFSIATMISSDWWQPCLLSIVVRFVTDSIYTERYMGLPIVEDNLIGYERTDISRRSEGIRGKKYMLIHGTADDNVHYQQAMALTKSLEHNDILFEQVTYTDETHDLKNVFPHLYHTMDKFWGECFGWDNWSRIAKKENRFRGCKSFAPVCLMFTTREKRDRRESRIIEGLFGICSDLILIWFDVKKITHQCLY